MQASPSCSNMNVVAGDGPGQRENASTSSHGGNVQDGDALSRWPCDAPEPVLAKSVTWPVGQGTDQSVSTSDAQAISQLQSVVSRYARDNHVSESEALRAAMEKSQHLVLSAGAGAYAKIDSGDEFFGKLARLGTGVSAGADMHTRVDASGQRGTSHGVSSEISHRQGQSQDFSVQELRDIRHGMDVITSHRVTDNSSHTENASGSLVNQMAATFSETQSLPADVRQAVRDAISLLSEKRTRFTYSDVLNRSLNNLDARSHVALLARQAIEEAISAQLLIPLDREKGLFTSSLHLLDELSLQDLARRIRNESVPGMARTRCASDVLPTTLTDGRLPIAIISLAGGMQNLSQTVLAAADLARTQGRAFRVLASDRAVARFLEKESLESGTVLTLNRLSQAELPEKATWVVAGAETLSLRDTVTVMDTALRTQSQLLMIDSSGRQGTGNALQILEEAGVVRLHGTSAPVSYAVKSEADKIQRYALLAEEYAGYFRRGETVAAQVSGPREQAALTARIRQALSERGCLGNRTVRVDTLLPVWLDRKNRRQLDTYREGMVLEYREPEKRSVVRYIIDRVSPETRSLRLQDDAGHKTGVKLSQMNADWGLYQPHTIEVAEGEKLIWFARQGKTDSRDSVTVKTINDASLTVKHRGKDRVISLHEPLKAGYGYVTPPGGCVQEKGVVLAAVAGREMTGRLLGTLARSGDRIRIFTSLAPEDARRRLSRCSGPRTVLSEVKQNEDELATALDTRRDALMSVTEKAVRQAVSLTQGSNVFFNRMDVLANALPLHPSLGKEAVDRELRRQIRTGELIPVPGVQGAALQRYVTAETYEAEKRIIRLVAEGLGTHRL
ncbi:hypothetical protein Q8V93_003397 [Enterobacter asburiae]|nr:hypothetical protein [Enterobacter asburiae]